MPAGYAADPDDHDSAKPLRWLVLAAMLES
jgi:hypothetical protein